MVIEIPPQRVDEAGEAMAAAFEGDPFCRWVMPDSNTRAVLLREMFTLTCRSRIVRNETLLGVEESGRIVAAICASGPGEGVWPAEIERAWDSFGVRLGDEGCQKFGRYLEVSKVRRPQSPHIHVNGLAVRPEFQGRGFGRALLDAVVQASESNSASNGVGLDTATAENVRFYERARFHVTAEVMFDSNSHWFMYRPNEDRS